MRRSDTQLKPRNGHTLIVGVPCRISGCANQKEASLDDQQDNARAEIAERYQGAVDFRVIAAIGKGERLDRPELEQIEKAYSSSEYDVFVYEDLSRLIRGGDAVRLLGSAWTMGRDRSASTMASTRLTRPGRRTP